ncbi:ETHYLENE INSENSITIVE 3-like 3 protein [Sesamum angolense]|uniref:ETHYLENE INSENSITIVE 3-like 3 protein n=1 Tax=Sesamum angolense TaxID=2727404 RepID=A0AAE1XAK6_9LAMI|nr:ETHYLENE INSENSITIVE 3-like 3 protein [Sesamum angolense]
MTAKESSIWLGVLSREEAFVQQPCSDNGSSGISEAPSKGRGNKRKPSVESDSDYDVDGVDNGLGSVSSKDDRRNQSRDIVPLEPPVHVAPKSVKDKKHVRERPRKPKHPKLSSANQLSVLSLNEHPRDNPDDMVMDVNHDNVQIAGFLMNESHQETDGITAIRPHNNAQEEPCLVEPNFTLSAPFLLQTLSPLGMFPKIMNSYLMQWLKVLTSCPMFPIRVTCLKILSCIAGRHPLNCVRKLKALHCIMEFKTLGCVMEPKILYGNLGLKIQCCLRELKILGSTMDRLITIIIKQLLLVRVIKRFPPFVKDAFPHEPDRAGDTQFPSPLNSLSPDLPGYSPFSLQFDGTSSLDTGDFDFVVDDNSADDNNFAELMKYFAS